ncbi:hypothetical protein [Streptomyces sp. NPDC001750]|uniref:hypothetical protein n=1 Tax=Streptomyces sp. NPDC001750 TaxID=3364607 RepID=UPI00367CDE1C
MLAEEFGYQVTSLPAAELTAALRPEVERARDEIAQKQRDLPSTGKVLTISFIGSCIIGIVSKQWGAFLSFLFTTLILGALIGSAVGTLKRKAAKLEEISSAVLTSPWQAWPCRVDAIPGNQTRRLLLLDPQGEAVRQFLAPAMPHETWIGLTDGRGLIWFAGDMRFTGITALPGGNSIFWVHPVDTPAPQPAPSTDRQRLIEEELTRRAVTYVFDEWL